MATRHMVRDQKWCEPSPMAFARVSQALDLIRINHCLFPTGTKFMKQNFFTWELNNYASSSTLTIEIANEAGMKEKAILAITAAEKASRSYKKYKPIQSEKFMNLLLPHCAL